MTFRPGSACEQWIYGDKKVFANRNPHTQDFFAAIGARAGTVLRVTPTGSNSLTIEKA